MADQLLEIPEETRRLAETAEANGHRAVREPLVYQFHEPRSYFKDLAISATDKAEARAAGERLEHHKRQMKAMPKGETRSYPGTNFEYRVNPNLETGHGLEFTIPAWLNEYFATARRPEQVLQRLAHEFDMPQGASSISVPRITQGTQVNDQTPNAPVDNQDTETATVKAQALYYSGESDWSMQALEQSPAGAHLDWVVFTDAMESLDAELEMDFISGKGEKFNEALGLTEISGINSITYTSAAPSGPALMKFLGEAAAQVGSKRRRPPTAWLMTTGRFFWIAFSEDEANRPLSIEDYPGSDFPNAGLGSVGVYFDDAISNELGAKKEEDVIIACRPDDFLLWHGPLKTGVFEETLSGTLQVRFLLYRFTATMLHRYPSGISKVTGTGMTVPTGFK